MDSIFGMHTIQLNRMKHFETLNIIVIENLFSHNLRIDVKYDLKGSCYKRTTSEEEFKSGAPLKDLDFRNRNERIKVSCSDYDKIISILNDDVDFLIENNIIDYSLLVGIHDRMKGMNPENSLSVIEERSPLETEFNQANEKIENPATPEREIRVQNRLAKDSDLEKTVKKAKPIYLKKQESPLST